MRDIKRDKFRSNYDINGNPINFDAFDPPYHANQYLETYFLYEYPKVMKSRMNKKTTYRDILTILKQRYCKTISHRTHEPIHSLLISIVL